MKNKLQPAIAMLIIWIFNGFTVDLTFALFFGIIESKFFPNKLGVSDNFVEKIEDNSSMSSITGR